MRRTYLATHILATTHTHRLLSFFFFSIKYKHVFTIPMIIIFIWNRFFLLSGIKKILSIEQIGWQQTLTFKPVVMWLGYITHVVYSYELSISATYFSSFFNIQKYCDTNLNIYQKNFYDEKSCCKYR